MIQNFHGSTIKVSAMAIKEEDMIFEVGGIIYYQVVYHGREPPITVHVP